MARKLRAIPGGRGSRITSLALELTETEARAELVRRRVWMAAPYPSIGTDQPHGIPTPAWIPWLESEASYLARVEQYIEAVRAWKARK